MGGAAARYAKTGKSTRDGGLVTRGSVRSAARGEYSKSSCEGFALQIPVLFKAQGAI